MTRLSLQVLALGQLALAGCGKSHEFVTPLSTADIAALDRIARLFLGGVELEHHPRNGA